MNNSFGYRSYDHDSGKNMYIQKAKLNGEFLENCWSYQKDFARGG